MRLSLMTWPEVEAHLATSTAAIVPIGSTEQHGPTGLIGTDALCAEAVANGVGEACGAVVAPVGRLNNHIVCPPVRCGNGRITTSSSASRCRR